MAEKKWNLTVGKFTKNCVKLTDGGFPYEKSIYIMKDEYEEDGSPAGYILTLTPVKGK